MLVRFLGKDMKNVTVVFAFQKNEIGGRGDIAKDT